MLVTKLAQQSHESKAILPVAHKPTTVRCLALLSSASLTCHCNANRSPLPPRGVNVNI